MLVTWSVGGDSPPPQRITEPVVLNNQLVFAYGNKLVASDGTEAGTRTIKELPDAQALRPEDSTVGGMDYFDGLRNLTVAGDLLFFSANESGKGVELWRSDGTEAGTYLVKDIRPGLSGGLEGYLRHRSVTLGNRVFFLANDGANGLEVWTSDGSSAGTRRVSDIATGFNEPTNLVAFEGNIFFTAADKLYKVNDAATASAPLAGAVGYAATSYTIGGGGRMLVRTITYNGQHRGTYILDSHDKVTSLGDFSGGDWSPGPQGIYFNDRFYFVANKYIDGVPQVTGGELWSSDGTAAGTTMVREFVPGVGDIDITAFRIWKKRLYFAAKNPADGNNWWLWRSDGTADGTGALEPLTESEEPGFHAPFLTSAIVGTKLHYVVHRSSGGDIVARTAGVGAGSEQALRANDPSADWDYHSTHGDAWFGYDMGPTRFVQLGDVVYFSPGYGKEIHRLYADGTVDRFAPLGPRAAIDSPTIAAAGQRLYTFNVTYDGATGGELSGYDLPGAIMVKGPNGFARAAAAISSDGVALNFTETGRRRMTVTYAINAPGGTWNSADRGRYTVWLVGDTVKGGGVPISLRALGRFKVIGADAGGAIIAGHALEDHDADGARDAQMPGDPVDSLDRPMPSGTRIYLDANNNGAFDASETSTMSDAAGAFRFSGLAAGTYVVRAVFPSNDWGQTNASIVTVRDGEWGRADVLLARYGTIGGTIYDDRNDSETYDDADAPLSGVTVLLDRNLNGRRDARERLAVTDASGKYLFRAFIGRYGLKILDGLGGRRVTAWPGDTASAGAGQDSNDNHYGATLTARAKASVYEDRDGDGTRDANEGLVADARVFVDLNGDGVLQPDEPYAKTAADKASTIRAIPAGTFALRVAPPSADWVNTNDAAAMTVTFSANDSGGDATFGLVRSAIIQGTVFHDLDALGFRSDDDPGLSGRSVFLDLNFNGAPDAGEPITITNGKGRYQFSVRPGKYVVRQVRPPGWFLSGRAWSAVTAQSGGVYARDFANSDAPRLTGLRFRDANANGVFDAGDSPGNYGFVYVDLNNNGQYESYAEPDDVALLDPASPGVYEMRLPKLAPGQYTIRIYAPGYTITHPAAGSYTITIAPGEEIGGLDFGLHVP